MKFWTLQFSVGVVYYIDRQKGALFVRIGFAGAGRVGCSMGLLLGERYTVSGYFSKSFSSAQEAALITKSSAFKSPEEICLKSDIIFITTPDDEIGVVWNKLKNFAAGKIVCHMSGACSALEVFPDAESYGVKTSSLHPLAAVSDKKSSDILKKALFTCEGKATEEISKIVSDCGISVKIIASDCKARYHASAVMNSNLVLSLLKMSCDELEKCGFKEKEALNAVKNLFMGNAEKIFEAGFEKSLTGPLERGDVKTLRKHLECLDGDTREVYRLLSKNLIKTAQQKNKNKNYELVREELDI